MALSASVFNPLLSGVHPRNFSAAGRNSRANLDECLTSSTCSYRACTSGLSSTVLIGRRRANLDECLTSSTCSYRACTSGLSSSVLIGRCSSSSSSRRSVIGGRLRCRQPRRERLVVFAAESNKNNQSGETGTTNSEADVEALEARLGLGRRARRQQAGSDNAESKPAPAPAKTKAPAKTWDSMSFTEKAWSVYIDPDKGVLYWLNKLAYGAIYTIIGAWIVFRFIGPALGWYQLDQPLLTPDRLLDGGP